MAKNDWITNETADGLTFGERLEDLIKLNNTTAAAVAEDTGVQQSAISDYLNRGKAPTCQSAILLAKYFNISTDYLLGLSRVKTPAADVQAVISYTGLSEENANTLCSLKQQSTLPFMDSDFEINASAPYIDCLNDILEALWSSKEQIISNYMIVRYYSENAKPHDPNCYDEEREQELLKHGQTTIPVRSMIEYKSTKIAKAIEQFLLDKYLAEEGEGL